MRNIYDYRALSCANVETAPKQAATVRQIPLAMYHRTSSETKVRATRQTASLAHAREDGYSGGLAFSPSSDQSTPRTKTNTTELRVAGHYTTRLPCTTVSQLYSSAVWPIIVIFLQQKVILVPPNLSTPPPPRPICPRHSSCTTKLAAKLQASLATMLPRQLR